jgi:gliding motility-associated-like protein
MKKLLQTIIIILFTLNLWATHNRAGEITYEHVSGNTYKITLITYTYTPSAANESRDQLPILWGDDTESLINRVSIEYLPDDIQKNTYIGFHTFPGTGIYEIVMSDPNRNANIVNIPESVTVIFTIKTILKIDAEVGPNNTPIMLNPPIDKAALNREFIHNPNAFDPDGDSLSYKLTICLGNEGLEIPGYVYPTAQNDLYVDPITGDFVWDFPVALGEYNVAMEIEEWRNGIKIGSIIRDMQIEVEETDNNPPVIADISDLCVTAGETVTYTVTATDPDGDPIFLTASGGPFEFDNNPASFTDFPVALDPPVEGTFEWVTICEHIRKQPYNVLFRAEDDNPEVGLTDYENMMITVVAPAPQNLNVSATSNSVTLNWDLYECQNASGFLVYRKLETYSYTIEECETGLPAGSGYQFVGSANGSSITSFTDNYNGVGLPQGYLYCYRITAYFEDGAESYISNEACTELIRAAPVFTETSVVSTDEQNGSIHLTWMKPTDFDDITYPGPYKYVLESRIGQSWQNFSNPIDIFGIDDTTYIDEFINTVDSARSYRVTMYSQNGPDWVQVDSSAHSSSLFIEGVPGNKRMTIEINDSTPWINSEFTIFRKDSDEDCTPNANPYDSITTVSGLTYTDHDLSNDNYYWYYVRSSGEYGLDFIPSPLINFSQEICVSPEDTIPPCSVNLSLETDCDLFRNYLYWTIDTACAPDIDNFLIFYSAGIDDPLEIIDTVTDNQLRYYIHEPELSLGACYVVSAQDSAGNFIEAEDLVRSCIDDCEYYFLPNVFSPNNDGINDLFTPLMPYRFVESIDMTIYNRWGNKVYETKDPDINWNGIDIETGKPVSDGVYYYVCDVYEWRLSGLEVRNIAGFVRIFSNTGNTGTD